jgi:hypothetical protein
MKKLIGALLALCASAAFAATTVPVQLISPTGSTAGQAIVSTGSTAAPAWGTPTPTSAFTVPISITSSASSGPTLSVIANSNTSSGSALFFSGNGGTTPNKTLQVLSGNLQVVNSAGSAVIFNLNDVGDMVIGGKLTTSQTGGIVGTTAANNAAAGSVGEFNSNSASGTSMVANTPVTCDSLSLAAGDYDVWGSVVFVPAGTTTVNSIAAGVSTTTNTLPTVGDYSLLNATLTTGANQVLAAPAARILLASTTTVFMVGQASFATSTMTCNGSLKYRRRR